MELKHVFFSSLLLSATFTACTNEEFTTEISAPVTVEDAISLGEGYTIVGSKMGDAASRAYVTSDLKSALWEKTDVIGAAWYNMATYSSDGKLNPIGSQVVSGKFASNTWFKWNKQVGNDMSTAEFKSDANAMAGAYVLYYPYNETITSTFAGIPVEVAYNQTMDCTEGHELDFVNDNLFSYCVYPFVPGGVQTANFEMKQLTNVFALTFQVNKQNLMILEKPVKITKVIVEATKSSTTVLNTKGSVKAPEATVDYVKGNYGTTKYTSNEDAKADHLILDVKNATDAYSIKTLETPTEKPFYITALPFSNEADNFTVKILTEDGKIYSKTFGTEALAAVNKVAVKEGQIIRLNVVLDDLSDEGTIYTADQFKTQWDDALQKGGKLNIGEGVDLSDMDLTINNNVNITLSGKSAKVKSLNIGDGTLTINNELSVAEDVTIGSNAKDFTTVADGSIAVDGKVAVQGTAGNVKFSKIGSLNVDASGIIAIEGVQEGGENVSEIGTITNEGSLTLKTVSVKTLSNTGTVTIGNENVTNEGTFTNKGTFAMNYDFANNGTFSQEGTISGTKVTFNNNAGATLDVKASTTLSSVKIVNNQANDKLAAAVINVSENVTLTAGSNTNGTITNNGIINVTGTLTEKASQSLLQETVNACINVSNEGLISFNSSATGVEAGYVKLSKDSKVINESATTTNPVLAQEVTNNTTVSDINTKADILITSGDINKTDLIAAIDDKDVVFNSGTITFTTATTFTNAIEVNGNVKFVKATDGTANVVLNAASTIKANSTLTIGNNIHLKGKSSGGTTVNLKNGAVLKTDGTGNISRGNSNGNIKVTYGN